jgi:hypothetical protein
VGRHRVAPIVITAMSATPRGQALGGFAIDVARGPCAARPSRIACSATTSATEKNLAIISRARGSLLAVGGSDYDLQNLLAIAPTV